jgi:hypothetical protein
MEALIARSAKSHALKMHHTQETLMRTSNERMKGEPIPQEERLSSIQYQEYVRLSDKADEYGKAAMADVSLVAAVAAILAWPPLTNAIAAGDNTLLFLGFMALLAVLIAIVAFSALKESILYYYLNEANLYGRALRTSLDSDGMCCDSGERWVVWFNQPTHKRLYGVFFIAGGGIAVAFPTALLFLRNAGNYAWIYLVISLPLLGLSGYIKWDAYRKMLERVSGPVDPPPCT